MFFKRDQCLTIVVKHKNLWEKKKQFAYITLTIKCKCTILGTEITRRYANVFFYYGGKDFLNIWGQEKNFKFWIL